MLNKSIAYRLSIYISLAVIGVFVVFIGIYFMFNKKFLQESVHNRAIGISQQLINSLESRVLATREITSNVADQIIFYGQQDHAELFIKSIVEKYSFINALNISIDSTVFDLDNRNYYCYKDNDSTYLLKGNTYFKTCTSGDEDFQRLIKNNEEAWSEPVRCHRNGHVVVAYYSPIEIEVKDGVRKRIGGVICELSMDELSESVNGAKIGQNGYAILLSKSGEYITHPVKEWILRRNIHELPKEIFDISTININEIIAERGAGTLVAYPELLDYAKCWVYYTPVASSGWTLVLILPYKELYEPLYLPMLQMLFFSVLGILIIYLLVTYISNRQIQPLSFVTQQLKKFSSVTGDSDEIPKNEIRQVSESLNAMQTWFEKYKMTRSEEAEKSASYNRDISQAFEIQCSFIKTDFPAFPERNDIDLYACYKPSKGVSGDLFDYFFLDDNHLVFSMGDVSGKGIPAAFFMSVAQTVIKNNATVKSAKKIVESVNNELFTKNHHQFFLTLFLGVLNIRTGKLTYCNAAHTIPYLLKENGKVKPLAQSHGLPLALYPDKKYLEEKVQMEKGDSVILYTDGVTELIDENKQQYGKERLKENLKSLAGQTPQQIVQRIEQSLELYIGGTPQSDDISILVLKYQV